jgi:Lrp/AsnC family leucine-responsive transcriptional regulator
VESKAIDRIDQTILGALQADGRVSWRELGERVHLSATSVGDRVRRLETAGIITGYRATIDPAALGRELRAVVELSLRPEVIPEDFEKALESRTEVTFAAYVTGAADYAIMLDCAGPEGLDAFTRWCKSNGASHTESRVVLRRVVG